MRRSGPRRKDLLTQPLLRGTRGRGARQTRLSMHSFLILYLLITVYIKYYILPFLLGDFLYYSGFNARIRRRLEHRRFCIAVLLYIHFLWCDRENTSKELDQLIYFRYFSSSCFILTSAQSSGDPRMADVLITQRLLRWK